MHIIKPEHNLINNISSVGFRKFLDFGQSLEKFTALNEFWDNVVVVGVFNQFNYPNYVGVAVILKMVKLILKQLLVNLIFHYFFLVNNFNGKIWPSYNVSANSDDTESILAKLFSKFVSLADILHKLKCFEIIHMQCLLFPKIWFDIWTLL